MNAANIPGGDMASLEADSRSSVYTRYPIPLLALVTIILSALQALFSGNDEIHELFYLPFFVPIVISARHLSRRQAVLFTTGVVAAYSLSFMPVLFNSTGSREELITELLGHVVLFAAAGFTFSTFRMGIFKEKEKAVAAERERTDRLRLMLDVSTTISSSLKIDRVLQVLSERIVDAIDATYCRISLLDESGDYLRVVAAHPSRRTGWNGTIGTTVPLSELPDHEKAMQTKEALIVGGRRKEVGGLTRRQEELFDHAKSLLLYPLVVGDKAVGIVCIGEQRKWERSPMGEEKKALCQTIVNQGAMAVGNALTHAAQEEAFVGTIRSLAEAIDAKDPSTRGHSDWVSKYAVMIGRQLGMQNGGLDILMYAGYLHDVGKIGIPDDILSKPGQLSPEEWRLMKKHPIVSARILEPVRISSRVKAAIRHHHERYDGKGYPYGLAGESIPLEARIMAVADSYEAMTSDRPYRKGLSDELAIAELVSCSGTQFDPSVVETFMRALGRTAPSAQDMDAGAEPAAG
ncbi:MAG: HD-GYP domain-containing protein [Thermoleophilia bacterium]